MTDDKKYPKPKLQKIEEQGKMEMFFGIAGITHPTLILLRIRYPAEWDLMQSELQKISTTTVHAYENILGYVESFLEMTKHRVLTASEFLTEFLELLDYSDRLNLDFYQYAKAYRNRARKVNMERFIAIVDPIPSKWLEHFQWREDNRFALRLQFDVVMKLLRHLRQMGLSKEYFISHTNFDAERLDLVLRNKAIATDEEIATINKFCDEVLFP